MSFVIAGIVLLLSLILGIIAYVLTPLYEEVNSDSSEKEDKTNLAMTLHSFVRKENWKQILFVVFIAIVCSVATYLSHNSGVNTFELCRQVVLAMTLLLAMIIDSKTRIIPNVLILISMILGVIILLLEFVFAGEFFLHYLIMSMAGFLCCFVLFYVLSRLTKDGIGMGDVKLISIMGFLVGLSTTLMSVLASLLLCTTVSIVLLLGKWKDKKDSVPFGPFLFFGYILVFILFSF